MDGAIHLAGGREILEECGRIRRDRYPDGLPAGEAVLTGAGRLLARFVIHTVGPVRGKSGGRDAELLTACYRNSLELAVQSEIRTIAFPFISTGAYGYPRAEAAVVSSGAIKAFLAGDQSLQEVRFVFFSLDAADVFLKHQRFDS